MPVLWITGPAGVGKSTVSWQLFSEAASSGTRVAFADADQLCMCYPPPPDDLGRDRIRARNAGALIRNYQAAGAQHVIVNGVVDPALGVQPGLLGQVEVMVCRLRADPGEVVRRLAGRHPGSRAPGAGGRAILLCGPAGVGKSTIGFQLYLRCLRAGLTAGYIDLDQIGFLTPPAADDPRSHRLKARNLAAIWRTYHAAGARHLVITGPAEDQAALAAYAGALPDAAVTACRLHAGPAELTRRIITRGEGGSWPQPGDPLRGQPASYLSQAARRAAAQARALDRAGLEARRIDTDGRTVGQAADLIATTAQWPGQADGPQIPDHAI